MSRSRFSGSVGTDRDVLGSVVVSAGFAALWALLAVSSPTTTFHVAPAVVAGVGTLRPPGRERRRATAATVALAAVTIAALDAAGALAGPSLLPVGGPVLEAVVVAIAGVVVGWVAGSRMAVEDEEAPH